MIVSGFVAGKNINIKIREESEMAFTNDFLLRTLQFIKSVYREEIREKSFLMLGKQEMHLNNDFMEVLVESGLIEDVSQFGNDELNDSILFLENLALKKCMH